MPDGLQWRFDRRGRHGRASLLVRTIGYVELTKHAPPRDVPRQFARRPIVACVGHPLDRMVSSYHFGFWRRSPSTPTWWWELGRREFAHFPELSVDVYVRFSELLADVHRERLGLEFDAGIQTVNFLDFYVNDPESLRGASAATAVDILRTDLENVQVLHTERLNADLARFLRSLGHDDGAVERVEQADRVLPTSAVEVRPDPDRLGTFGNGLAAEQLEREQLLFDVFTENDAHGLRSD